MEANYRNAAIVAALLLAAYAPLAQASDDRTINHTVPAAARGTVEINNTAGTVEIIGWDRNEVQVSGTIARDVERVDVLSEADRVRVLVALPRQRNVRRGSADLEVRVPRGASVKCATVSADVTSTGVRGDQEIGSVSGEITADISGVDVTMKSVSGDVRLRGDGKPANLEISTVSGNVRLDRSAGAVEAVTVSGDIEVELGKTTELRVRTTSGNLEAEAHLTRDARVAIETVSGDLRTIFPSDAGFTTDIESFSGDIEGCFESSVRRVSKYGPGTRLEVKHGEGAARIRAKSLSGDIMLCDK
jgi:DUF4097 and DUF4098 domain-containing protein YvlB